MHIRCLGALVATEGERDVPLGGPKQRLVLAHLLTHANRTVPVDRLIADVWGDDPPRAVRSSLQSFVSHLRKALGTHRIDGGGQGYALRVAVDEVDRIRFEALAARGRTLRTTDPAAAAATLTEALDLWRGTPFADLTWAPSLQPEITRLDELRAATVEERVTAELDCGRLSPDGDIRTGRQVAAAQRQSGILYAVAFAPDGHTVATAGADRAVHLWDASSGRERLALRAADGEIGSVEFSPDGSKLAASGEGGLARGWALDLDDLIAIATGELTRGLSRAECRQFLHVDTCPQP